jgi:hypothetical protein
MAKDDNGSVAAIKAAAKKRLRISVTPRKILMVKVSHDNLMSDF